jgi:signal peptidase I
LTTHDNAAETAAADPSKSAGTGPGPSRRPAKTMGQQIGSVAKELIFILVGAIIVSSLLRAFVGQMFIIPSQSMESTLLVGDRVVVQKITDFHRGDVVVFQDPGGWLSEAPAEDPTAFDRVLEFVGVPTQSTPGHLIKRVIGMPGDRVICCDSQNRLTVNGYPLNETSYLYTDPNGTQVDPSDLRFEVVVPRDRIFVMGDHRDLSADSRCHLSDLSTSQGKGEVAFVPIKLVVGPALAVVAPLNRASRLRDPATFSGVPAATEPAPAEAVIKPEGLTC